MTNIKLIQGPLGFLTHCEWKPSGQCYHSLLQGKILLSPTPLTCEALLNMIEECGALCVLII